MRLPQIGEHFKDRYEIVQILGQGGFATVYRGRDPEMSRDVVLKILSPDLDGTYREAVQARFMLEAQVFATLQSPSTITMYDFGESNELLYMVFEYVPGQDLELLLHNRGRFQTGAVIHIMRQLLHALHEAHDKGVLHRDIKPANVLLYEYGGDPHRVKLLDFGIAKDTRENAERLTQTGRIVGTPKYMAPEQIFNETIGPETDIYSLGLVACELLTGHAVISGASQREILLQQTSDAPLRVPETFGTPGLRAVVDKMIAREPVDRYSSASEVLAALQALHSPAPTPTVPAESESTRPLPKEPEPRSPVKPRPSEPSRRAMIPLLAVILLAVLSSIGAIAMLTRSTAELPPTVLPAPPEALLKTAPTPARSPTVPSTTADLGAPLVEDMARDSATGCGAEAPFRGAGTLDDGGAPLTAYIPQSYTPDKPAPVVMLFHRQFRDGRQVLGDTLLGEVAERHGFIVLAPDSLSPALWSKNHHHIVFEALKTAHKRLCIDRSKLFAVGDEAGSRYAWTLACELPLSGIAAAFDGSSRTCVPAATTPRIRLYGTRDKNMPASGGWGCNLLAGNYPSAETIRDNWRQTYDCEQDSKPWSSFAHGKCEHWTCKHGDLVDCAIDAGHQWPGSDGATISTPNCAVEPLDDPFPMAAVIWKFFDEYGHVLDEKEQAAQSDPLSYDRLAFPRR